MQKWILSFIMVLLPLMANADAVEINGIYYNLISKAKVAEVTSNPNKYTGDITIPAKVTYESIEYEVKSIAVFAFYDCKNLISVTIPNSVTSIDEYAFYDCSCLTSINIGESVTNIGEWTFYGCSSLTSVLFPNSVTSIGEHAFSGCSGLTSVNIPKTIISIGEGSFSGCCGLTTINVESDNQKYDSRNNCNAIIESLTNTLIAGCENTIIPNSVTTIGVDAFLGCSGLTSIIITNNVTTIDEFAFSHCSSMKSVVIPKNMISIGNYAFFDCSSLTEITIENGVNDIGEGAFSQCSKLTDIYCLAENVPNTESNPFDGSYIEYATLHVPASSIEAYKAIEPWKNFKEIVALESGDIPETQKCATPTISIDNGEIVFSCETEGVDFVSEVTTTDVKKYYDNRLKPTYIYQVSVYATKAGYDNSDTATAKFTVAGKQGDMNNDGKITITDALMIVDTILKKEE